MSTTGLDVFDTTVHTTNNWLNELMQLLIWDDKRRAYRALRETLHALRDRLPIDEVAQLGAQLPMLIRGFYYEEWDPTGKPLRVRHADEFLAQIETRLQGDYPIDAEEIARAVFTLLSERISDGEIDDVKQVLPAELRSLWPVDAVGAGVRAGPA
jgi:uncharacterized protein (DUF2267 family)